MSFSPDFLWGGATAANQKAGISSVLKNRKWVMSGPGYKIKEDAK